MTDEVTSTRTTKNKLINGFCVVVYLVASITTLWALIAALAGDWQRWYEKHAGLGGFVLAAILLSLVRRLSRLEC